MKDTAYHSILRIATLTLALVLIFDSGLLSPVTKSISLNTQNYLATAIGMHAGVIPTELNELTADLTKRERDLAMRENDIAAREIAVNLDEAEAGSGSMSTYIMSVLLFLLLLLIIMNYVLDYIRMTDKRKIIKTDEKVA